MPVRVIAACCRGNGPHQRFERVAATLLGRSARLAWRAVSEGDAGTALVEALVACGVLALGVVALVQLFVVSAQAARDAGDTTVAASLAGQKAEELRGLVYGVDAAGASLTDTSSDTATSPESATGGTGLSTSPRSSLVRDTPGYVDYVDQHGTKVGEPAAGTFTRRWSITPLPESPDRALVVQVWVTRRAGPYSEAPGHGRLPGQASVVTVRRRGQP